MGKKKIKDKSDMLRYVISRNLLLVYGGKIETYHAMGDDAIISMLDNIFSQFISNRSAWASVAEHINNNFGEIL